MTRKDIIKELQNRGYKAEECNVVKNGVEFYGIRILTDSNIAPVIYTEELIKLAEEENKSLDEVVKKIISIYAMNKKPSFDVNDLNNKDFILNHLFIGLQKESTEEIIKKPCEDFEGIESYLFVKKRISEDTNYFVRVTKKLIDIVGITEDEAWEQAERNTFSETTIINMAKMLAGGMEYVEEIQEEIPLFVLTNKSRTRGASGILNKKLLKEFGEKHNTHKIVVLPSSIHEVILKTYQLGEDIEEMSAMVKEINSSMVDPEERLTDRAYIVTI